MARAHPCHKARLGSAGHNSVLRWRRPGRTRVTFGFTSAQMTCSKIMSHVALSNRWRWKLPGRSIEAHSLWTGHTHASHLWRHRDPRWDFWVIGGADRVLHQKNLSLRTTTLNRCMLNLCHTYARCKSACLHPVFPVPRRLHNPFPSPL